MSVKKYRVYCTDESKHVTGWSEAEPTTCFNNDTHTIDVNQTAVTDIQVASSVHLEQTSAADNSDVYYLFSQEFTVSPGCYDLPLGLDVDVNMFAVQIHARADNIGDSWSAAINKDTPIGYITAPVVASNIISIPPESIPFAKIGYYISIDGGVSYNRIIDKTTNTLILKHPVTVNAGIRITMTYFLIHNKTILVAGKESLGGSIFGSFKIPKEYKTTIVYENKSHSDKHVVFDIEVTF